MTDATYRIFSIDFSAINPAPFGARTLPGHPILYCDNATVYRATGVFASGQVAAVEFAVKFGDTLALAEEADVYDALEEEDLVGTVTPSFFGMLLATIPNTNNKELVACTITELWGSHLERQFRELAKTEKSLILDKLVAIHHAGFSHCDFERYNVLYKDGDFRIVDFGDVESGHRCHPGRTQYNFAEAPEFLDRKDVICAHIYSVAEAMRVWERGTVYIHDIPYDKNEHALPPQHEIYQFSLRGNLRYYNVPDKSKCQWRLKFFKEIRRQRDRGFTIEQLKTDERMAKMENAATRALSKYS
ncbi:hypothetical protein C8J56DRAFT_1164606 [Mycena floridula]|nr:hypothetical protein C8J56DRAFT_1164606 [Mycena floridula]